MKYRGQRNTEDWAQVRQKPLDPYRLWHTEEAKPSRAMAWWVLINQAEWLTSQSGYGLASVWQWIHQGKYAKARRALDYCLVEWNKHCDTAPSLRGKKTPWQDCPSDDDVWAPTESQQR